MVGFGLLRERASGWEGVKSQYWFLRAGSTELKG